MIKNTILDKKRLTFEELLKIERTLKETSDIRLLKQYEFQVLSHKQQTVTLAKSAGIELNDVFLSVLHECNGHRITIHSDNHSFFNFVMVFEFIDQAF